MELPAKVEGWETWNLCKFPLSPSISRGQRLYGVLEVKMQLAILDFLPTGLAEFMGKDDNNLQNLLLSFMSNLVYT